MEQNIEISVVTPVYKAEECLEELHARLVRALEAITERFEIIMVNDASPDDSWALIRDIAKADPRVRGINLSRNFGQHYAIAAGLDHASGNWTVVMDCDLQHRPEDIERMYRKVQEGHDIILVRRLKRHDSFGKKLASRAFVTVYNYLSDIKIDPTISTFSMISRQVVLNLRALKEHSRSYGMMLHWIGFDVGYIDGEHAERFAGKSAYSTLAGLHLAIESVCSQSNRPLALSIQFGFMMAFAAVTYAIWLAIRYFFRGITVPGWTSVMVSIFFLSGLLFANIGVIGLYLGRVFDETKDRPLYVVKTRLNLLPDPLRDRSHSTAPATRGVPE